MSATRSNTTIHLIGESLEGFGGRVLPMSLEILKVYFHYHTKTKMSQKDAVKTVVQDICDIWNKARIPISEERHIARKMDSLLEKYRNICRNKNRRSSTQLSREAAFVESINTLFDISHHDALNLIKIEEDKQFLMDQRLERKYVMGGVDINLTKKENKKAIKSFTETERFKKEEMRKRRATETAQLSSSSDDEEADPISDPDAELTEDKEICFDVTFPSTSKTTHKRVKMSAKTIISGDLASALDRTNITNRNAAYVLAAAAKTYGHPDASMLPLSVSSIRRSREQHRSQHVANIKVAFSPDGPLIIHFDGKLLPHIYGGPKKQDRVAILVSGHKVEKLLGVPIVEQGTGEKVAQVALQEILEWNVQNQIVGMSFDTTATNTGRLNGACILLEQKLQKELLWLACRHHVHEVVCGDVFKALFGTTSGPNVLIFRRFHEFWPKIKRTEYEPCSDSRLDGELQLLKTEAINFANDTLQRKSRNLLREDYRELLELTLIFLGEIPPRGISFRVPGAFHHARWMSKLLYVLKINLFRKQFKLTKQENKSCLEFGLFVVLIYVKAWTSCPNTCDAPMNDLNLIQAISNYRTTSEVISRKAISAISRHLWYLGQEMAPLGLFSDLVSTETKRLMVASLQEHAFQGRKGRSVRYTGTEDLSNKTLDYFIGPGSHFLFQVLRLDTSFLAKDVDSWEDINYFQEAKNVVMALKVVNDSAERGIALATTFNSSLTKHEDQKQFIFQVVEDHRKRFPDTKKDTLFKET